MNDGTRTIYVGTWDVFGDLKMLREKPDPQDIVEEAELRRYLDGWLVRKDKAVASGSGYSRWPLPNSLQTESLTFTPLVTSSDFNSNESISSQPNL